MSGQGVEEAAGGGAGSSTQGVKAMLLPQAEYSRSTLSGTDDLLGTFGLLPAYDEHVRPYVTKGKPAESTSQPTTGASASASASASGIVFKFGGQALASPTKPVQEQATYKKMEKTYAHLVRDIMGKNRIKKDDHIERLAKDPAWFAPPRPFPRLDDDQLRSAFTLQTGLIPGFDSTVWQKDDSIEDPLDPTTAAAIVGDSPQHHQQKRKKKRKHPGGSSEGANIVLDGGAPHHDSKRPRKDD